MRKTKAVAAFLDNPIALQPGSVTRRGNPKPAPRCPITGQPLSVREQFETECG